MIPIEDKNEKWTLFLDRDGVLNEEIHGGYVNEWKEFRFYPDTLSSLQTLSDFFHPIIVVTNQRGVGKGITKLENLHLIHENMIQEIQKNGGRIDRVYFCSDIDSESAFRKPNSGMALQAKADFPKIDFNKSIMVGNNLSDMRFGKRLEMHTVFITSTHPEMDNTHPDIDMIFPDLSSFASWMMSKIC